MKWFQAGGATTWLCTNCLQNMRMIYYLKSYIKMLCHNISFYLVMIMFFPTNFAKKGLGVQGIGPELPRAVRTRPDLYPIAHRLNKSLFVFTCSSRCECFQVKAISERHKVGNIKKLQHLAILFYDKNKGLIYG